MLWKPILRIAAVIARTLQMRRFGTLRAFVVRGYEHIQRERAVAGNVEIGRTSKRCGIF